MESTVGPEKWNYPAYAFSTSSAKRSDREVEVLEQAATGKTNAEIGEALYISPRTVAQHLRSVYNKLGVNSRKELIQLFDNAR